MKARNTAQNIALFLLALVSTQLPQIGLGIATYSPKLPFAVAGVIVFLALYALVLWAFKKFFIHEKVFKRIKAQDLLTILAAYVSLWLVKYVYAILSKIIYKETLETANDAVLSQMLKIGGASTFILLLMIVLLAPLCEELLFRAMFFEKFFRNSFWLPIIVSGLLFSCLHISTTFLSFALYAMLGFIFGFLYKKTGNLSLCLILHILNNAPVLLLFA